MTVHIATDAEKAALADVMGPAFNKAFGDATGEDGVKLLELISKM
jgi:C4-dicarboxylate-binding protein DctP